MRHNVTVVFFIILFSNCEFIFAQCPNQFVSVADTICPEQLLNVHLSDTSLQSIKWDLCPGDLTSIPQITTHPASPNVSVKAIKENGKYYVWYPANISYHLIRQEYDSSLSNTPVSFTSNDFLQLSGGAYYGFDMVKDTGKTWIGMIADFATNDVYKVVFDSIDDNILAFTKLNLPIPANSGVYSLKIIDHSIFISANNLAGFIRVSFNSSFQDTVSVTQIPAQYFNGTGIDVVYDCSLNKYFLFLEYYGGEIWRGELGNSVLNSVFDWQQIVVGPGTSNGLELIANNNNWFLLTTSASPPAFYEYILDGITSLPVLILDTAINAPFATSTIYDSSAFHVIASSNSSSLTEITFLDGCSFSGNWDEQINPNLSYPNTSLGWQYFQITTQDSNFVTSSILDSVFVTIPPPVANFTTSGTCFGSPVSFNDASEICYGTITNWYWDFGDNAFDSLQNTFHTYNDTGNYIVTLTVISTNGDSATFQNSIQVVFNPVADFLFTDSICANTDIQLINLSDDPYSAIISWQWSFGNSDTSFLQNPSYTYDSAGTYSIELIVINSEGCTDDSIKQITILPAAVADFSFSKTCIGDSTEFINATDSAGLAGVSYYWDFGDTNNSTIPNPLHAYANLQSAYQVILIATASNGCNDTSIKNINVSNKAHPEFSVIKDSVCVGSEVQFFDQSVSLPGDSIINRVWNFGDNSPIVSDINPVHIFDTSGTFTITLTVTTPTACDSAVQKTITVVDNPNPEFIYTNVCLGGINTFTDNSLAQAGDPITTWHWTFGDDSSATGSGTSHYYADAGQYVTTLIITSQLGCKDSVSKPVDVYYKPDANFIQTSLVCKNDTTFFIDLSDVTNSSISSWNWNFGDNSFSTDQNPYHVFSLTGIDTVTLIVYSAQGCSDTVFRTVDVKRNIEADFSVTKTCQNEGTIFTFINLDTVLYGTSFKWSFTGGSPAISQFQAPPPILYSASGYYDVSLITTGSNLCKSYLTKSININPKPQANFSVQNPCSNQTTILNDLSFVSSGVITNWLWVLNNIDTIASQNYSFISNSASLIPLILVVTSDSLCTDTLLDTLQIYQTPVADFIFTPPYVTPGQNVTFTSTSIGASSFYWNFGDTNFGTQTPISHAYADTGLYYIQLTAISDEGCSDSITHSYHVLFPHADIAITNASSTISNSLLTLKATLLNLSNFDITNFQIKAEVENVPAIFEFPTLSLPVGSAPKNFTFQSKVYMSTNQLPSYYCIEVDKPNGLTDTYFNNNIICKGNGSTLEILNIPAVPLSDNLTINFNLPNADEVTLKMYDALGKLVLSDNSVSKPKGYNTLKYDISFVASGIYEVILSTSNEMQVIKISKN